MMTKRSSSITIRDVARQANVSVATVSRYINHSQPVAPETAMRLESVLSSLNYVPHAAARNLATRTTRIIGLLLSDIRADFYAPLLRGLDSVVQTQGYNLIVSSYHPEVNNQVPLPIGPQNTDGIVVFADSLGDDIIRSLVEKQFPVVLIHRSAPKDCNVPCVTIENKATSRKLVDHLIEDHGRRRIAFLRGPQLQEDSKWREQGYCESLLNHNLAIDPTLILNGEFDRDIARESVLSFFQRSSSDCDAIFCGDDDAAIGVVGALHDLHLDIPGQVSVVGFDDQSISAYLDPPLTTVRAPTEMVGRQAAAVLFGLLSGQSVAPVMLLQTEIVYRRSCGCHE